MTRLEHVNVTVADPDKTAEILCHLFGWQVRWAGKGMTTGRTVHVGAEDSYLALFSFGDAAQARRESYRTLGGMNHIGVVVEDLDAIEARIKEAGYHPVNHADYDPGRRFYFKLEAGVRWKW